MKDVIGFIGAGNMGTALLTGARGAYGPEQFTFYDHHEDKRAFIEETLGVKAAANAADVAKKAKFLFLTVKPQNYEELLGQIRDELTREHIMISVAPGVTGQWICRTAGTDCRVVRVMPNTPALIGSGMTGFSYEEGALTDEESEVIMNILSSCGIARRVDESLMDTVICASGSSPAFYYLFIDAIAKRCEAWGMSREDAVLFAAQTAIGSARMILETGEDPAILAERVCSKGGTTIEGVQSLQRDNLDSVVARAIDATYTKAKAMRKD